MDSPQDGYTRPNPVATASFKASLLGAPGFRGRPSKQLTGMQGRSALHASIPKGLAGQAPSRGPRQARMPPPLTRRCPAPAHPPGTQPHWQRGCPSIRLPAPPATPTAGPITRRAPAPPRWRRGGQGTPTGGPRPRGEGRGRRSGRARRRALPAFSARPAAFGPRTRGQPTRPAGCPLHGPPPNPAAPAPRSPQPTPSGPPARDRPAGTSGAHGGSGVGWRATHGAGGARAGGRHRSPGVWSPRRSVPGTAKCRRGAHAR